MVRKLTSAILIASAAHSPLLNALGLGELTLKSALNQPLVAEVELLNIGDLSESQIVVRMADQDAYAKAGIDREYYLSGFRFRVELSGNGKGKVIITSKRPLNEPFINFLVETRWPSGRVLREYTALVDLPVYSGKTETQVNLGTTKAYQQKAQQLKLQQPEQTQTKASRAAVKPSPRRQSAVQYSSNNDGEYRIRNHDNLYSIAKRFRPSNDVSIEQTMIAIQQLNPNAFIRNNINLLKAGSVLRLPDANQIHSTSLGEAKADVRRQHQQWRNKESVAAGSLDARADTKQQERFAGTEGQLRLSSDQSDQSDQSSGGGQSGRGSASSDETIALTLENEELNTKVDSLEQQLEKLQRLLELKNSELASMQQNLAASAAQQSADASSAEPEQSGIEQAEQGQVSEAIDASGLGGAGTEETSDAEAALEEGLESNLEGQAEVTEELVTEEPEVAAAEDGKGLELGQAPEQDLLNKMIGIVQEKPWMILLLIVPILLIVLLMRLRKGKDDADIADTDDFDVAANFDTSAETETNDLDDAFSAIENAAGDELDLNDVPDLGDIKEENKEAAPSVPVQSQTGDVVGEADIYVAYGRFEQAIALLKGAIEENPQQADVQLKLLEVYLEENNMAAAQAQLAAVEATGDQDAISKAHALLSGQDESAGADLDSGSELSNDFNLDLDTSAEDPDTDLSDLDEPAAGDDLEADLNELDELSAELDLDSAEDDIEKTADTAEALDSLEEATDDINTESLAELEDEFSPEGLEALDKAGELDDIPSASLASGGLDEAAAGEPADELSHEDEVTTKLDLARAYIDMGDVDGAKEILEEVTASGEGSHQEEAQALLKQLS